MLYGKFTPMLEALSLVPIPFPTLASFLEVSGSFVFWGAVLAVLTGLVINAGWANLTALTLTGQGTSVLQITRMLGRQFHFDFAIQDNFPHRTWARWAERVRTRGVLLVC